MSRRVPILTKLLGATLLPTVATFAGFGLLAHYIARRSLEEGLGRRLTSVAQAAALAVRSEQVDLLQPGDEESRAYRNVRRKLTELRDATGVQRIYLFDPTATSRGDTETLPIGARYYALDAARSELGLVFAGTAASSVLFTGKDGALYKSGFAPLTPLEGDAGAPRVAAGVDGSAALYEQLAGFRRTLFAASAAGLTFMGALSIVVARFITRPLRRLERAARAIGEGDLTATITATSADEIGYLATTLDTMREQLRARDERLQMMLAGIAHEVRNPLGGMELFAGILRDELAGDMEKLAHVGRIERELGHLKTVVNDFLEYARRARPELTPTDAADLLREVHQVLAADAEREEVGLIVDAPHPARVACDPPQLRRALLNLGRNALQACEAGGQVTLGCSVDGARVRLSVRDTGRGIDPEKRAKIFTPFFTTREKGTGLGLAFVAEIARDHGGTIAVDSAPGQGALFTLHLPRLES
ncbi:MAG: HAMP domain-containing histidine kinase [Myxococcales bacterium]|nr:HAMP domain-containing histidine kinase [Myxococcales bacterium]